MTLARVVFVLLLFCSATLSKQAGTRQTEQVSIEALLSWGRLTHQLISSSSSSSGGVDRLESSRRLAAVYVALHDTVTTIRNKYGGYWYALNNYNQGASGHMAVAAASKTVLLEFFPGNSSQINTKYDQYVTDTLNEAERDGVLAGELVARAVMRSMEVDGSQTDFGKDGGSVWNAGYKAQWATLQPWCIEIGPRRSLLSGQGSFMLDEPLDSPYVTQAELELALNQRSSPFTGNLCNVRPETIAETALSAAETAHLEFEDTARLMALVSMSMADATILAWAVKHEYDTPTTTQYIRNLSASFAQWTPFNATGCYTDKEDTESPGDYIDLHSTVAAAGLSVLGRVFGNNPPFYASLSLPRDGGGSVSSPLLITDFDALSEAICKERADSGAVFNTSAVMGVHYGRLAGTWIYTECLPREPMTTTSITDETATTPTPEEPTDDNETDTGDGGGDTYTDPPWPLSDLMDVRRLGLLLACCLTCVLLTSFACCCVNRLKCCRRPCCPGRRRCCKREPPYTQLERDNNQGIEMGDQGIIVV